MGFAFFGGLTSVGAPFYIKKEEMNMKKIIALILVLILCFGLCACGDDGDKITVVSKGMSPIINDGDTVFCHSIEDA